MTRQQNNERLRLQFAKKANEVGQWTEQQLDTVTNMGLQKGSLEDHLAKLRTLEQEVAQYRPNFDELEVYNQEVQEAMIYENKHSSYTMEVRLWLEITVQMPSFFEISEPETSDHASEVNKWEVVFM